MLQQLWRDEDLFLLKDHKYRAFNHAATGTSQNVRTKDTQHDHLIP
jgi:hypothetical protein